MTPAAQKDALRRHLRRKYQHDLDGLRTLCDELALKGMEPVTITSLSSEGGSSAGAVTVQPLLLLAAAEEVLAELDPSDDETPQDTAVFRILP